MKWMPTSPTALFTAICTSGMPLSAMAASGSCTQNTMTIIAEQVQMSSVSMYTDRLYEALLHRMRHAGGGGGVRGRAHAGLIGEQAALMPSMTTEPAKPPAMDWKLKGRLEDGMANTARKLANVGDRGPQCNKNVGDGHDGHDDGGDDGDALRAAENDESGEYDEHDAHAHGGALVA